MSVISFPLWPSQLILRMIKEWQSTFFQVEAGELEFDYCLSSLEFLPNLSHMPKILREKMPNTRRGMNEELSLFFPTLAVDVNNLCIFYDLLIGIQLYNSKFILNSQYFPASLFLFHGVNQSLCA